MSFNARYVYIYFRFKIYVSLHYTKYIPDYYIFDNLGQQLKYICRYRQSYMFNLFPDY
jgi:hypothetical protein